MWSPLNVVIRYCDLQSLARALLRTFLVHWLRLEVLVAVRAARDLREITGLLGSLDINIVLSH